MDFFYRVQAFHTILSPLPIPVVISFNVTKFKRRRQWALFSETNGYSFWWVIWNQRQQTLRKCSAKCFQYRGILFESNSVNNMCPENLVLLALARKFYSPERIADRLQFYSTLTPSDFWVLLNLRNGLNLNSLRIIRSQKELFWTG